MYKNCPYFENSGPNCSWSKLGSFVDKHKILHVILNKVRKRLFDSEFSFLPMPVASSIKNQFKLPKSLLACGQRLDRVVFCLRPFDFNDFGSN